MEEIVDGWVDASAMLAAGCYALVYRGRVVYIGQSRCMLQRVYAHRASRGKKAALWLPKAIAFDAVWVWPCHPDRLDALERELIAAYRPRFNIQLKPAAVPAELAALVSGIASRPTVPTEFKRRV